MYNKVEVKSLMRILLIEHRQRKNIFKIVKNLHEDVKIIKNFRF